MATLEGRTAIVTGASSGIGRGIVARFIAEGANVVAVSRQLDALQSSLGDYPEERAVAVAGDAGEVETATRAIQTSMSRFGGLDILVNGVGNASIGDVTTLEPDQWDQVLRTNLTSAYLFSRAAIPQLRLTRGSIVNLSSVQSFRGDYGTFAYNATKAALNNLTYSMALDFGRDGIRVNAVAPGFIETPRTAAVPDASRDAHIARTPLRRTGTPADVAAAVTFLVSDESAFITGAVLPVDGGRQAGSNSPLPAAKSV